MKSGVVSLLAGFVLIVLGIGLIVFFSTAYFSNSNSQAFFGFNGNAGSMEYVTVEYFEDHIMTVYEGEALPLTVIDLNLPARP